MSPEKILVFFLVAVISLTFFMYKKNPRLGAYILMGICILLLTVSFYAKGQEGKSSEALSSMTLVLGLICIIPGGILLYKSTSKKE